MATTNMVASTAPTGMLVPVFVYSRNLYYGPHPREMGHVSLHLDISFRDFLSQVERNLVAWFTYTRHVLVIAIDNVEHFGSTGSFQSTVNKDFNFSRIVKYEKRCHFVVDVVVVDVTWDRYRGDPVIEFETWRGWKEWEEDNNKEVVGFGKREASLLKDFPCRWAIEP